MEDLSSDVIVPHISSSSTTSIDDMRESKKLVQANPKYKSEQLSNASDINNTSSVLNTNENKKEEANASNSPLALNDNDNLNASVKKSKMLPDQKIKHQIRAGEEEDTSTPLLSKEDPYDTDSDPYSSSSSESTYFSSTDESYDSFEDENVHRAMHFLSNSSLHDLPYDEKVEYLKSKGLSEHQIESANSRLLSLNQPIHNKHKINKFNSRRDRRYKKKKHDRGTKHNRRKKYKHHKQRLYTRTPALSQHQSSLYPASSHPNNRNVYGNPNNPYHQNQYPFDEDDPSYDRSLISAASFGGMLSITALAALRWLNGGDFVLFPPPQTNNRSSEIATANSDVNSHNTSNIETTPETEMEAETVSGDIKEILEMGTESSNVPTTQYDASVLKNYNNQKEIEPKIFPDSESNQNDLGNSHYPNAHTDDYKELSSSLQILTKEIQNLSTSIHDLRLHKEKEKSKETSNQLTNHAMTLLQSSTSETENPLTNSQINLDAHENKNYRIMFQLAEAKAELSIVKQLLSSSSSSQQKPLSDEVHKQTKTDNIAFILNKINESMENIETQMKFSGNKEWREKMNQTNRKTNDNTNPIINDLSIKQSNSAIPQNSSNQHTIQVTSTSLLKALQTIQSENDDKTLAIGGKMLHLYTLNLAKNPKVPRYRKIYTSNASFQNKVGILKGGIDLLLAIGFVQKDSLLEWEPEAMKRETNNESASNEKQNINVTNLNFATNIVHGAAFAIQNMLSNPRIQFTFENNSVLDSTDSIPTSLPNLNDDKHTSTFFQTPEPKNNLLVSPPMTKKTDFLDELVNNTHTPLRLEKDDKEVEDSMSVYVEKSSTLIQEKSLDETKSMVDTTSMENEEVKGSLDADGKTINETHESKVKLFSETDGKQEKLTQSCQT